MNLDKRTPLPGEELIGFVPLFGLALLVVNDHLLRVLWPSWLTGKLSDFGIILFFPFLLTATYNWAILLTRFLKKTSVKNPVLNSRQLAVSVLFTGAWLAAVNLIPMCREFYLVFLRLVNIFGIWRDFQYVMDPGDCFALLLMPISWWYGKRIIKKNSYEKTEQKNDSGRELEWT